ncbi:hypothetical protein LBMAG27_01320 [Bacteroidota bacterium]|nr:hypothetical protein LBMAG27_01320 [Bacteroidota bacterium]
MKLFKFISTILFSVLINFSSAQDIHFSQFYATPLQVNPAKTGFITGDYRLAGNYRNQWSSITVPYTTAIGSAELSFVAGKKKKDVFGTGFMFINDKAGDSRFNTSYIGLSEAYNVAIGKYNKDFLGFGLMGAYCLSNISYDNLRWDEQYEGGTFTEVFPIGISDYYDLSLGAEYNKLIDKSNNFTAGMAMYHVFKPNQTFNDDPSSRVFRKLVVNVGANLGMGNKFTAYPKLLFEKQGPFNELVIGYLQRYSLNYNYLNDYGVYIGAMMRWNDAFIFVTKIDLNKFTMGISYDINFSRLALVSHARGGPEISVMYTNNIPGMHKKKIFCPRF